MYSFLIVLGTAVASMAHGGDYASKWVIAAGHAILLALVLWLATFTPWAVIAGMALSLFYWLAFRGSAQAKPELGVIDAPLKGNVAAVRKAYIMPVAACIGIALLMGWPDFVWPLLLAPVPYLAGLIAYQCSVGTSHGAKWKAESPSGRKNRMVMEGLLGVLAGACLAMVGAAWAHY